MKMRNALYLIMGGLLGAAICYGVVTYRLNVRYTPPQVQSMYDIRKELNKHNIALDDIFDDNKIKEIREEYASLRNELVALEQNPEVIKYNEESKRIHSKNIPYAAATLVFLSLTLEGIISACRKCPSKEKRQ